MGQVLVYAPHGFLPMETFAKGIAQVSTHRVTRRASSVYGYNDYESCVTCVVFGAKEPMDRVIQDQCANNTPVLVMDLGYIHRGNIVQARKDPAAIYWSVNLNGLNGWGDLPRSPMPTDRWEQLNVTIQPWKSTGSHFLVCGQKPYDAAIGSLSPLMWAQQTIEQLRKLTTRPIRWRPHPEDLTSRRHTIEGATRSTESLAEDLSDAYGTIAYNSNVLVDSLLAGVPIYILGQGSVCQGMGHTVLTEETLTQPLRTDRRQFFADLAYRQWTIPELELGLPWKHLIDFPTPDNSTTPPPVATSSAAPPPGRRRGRPRKEPQPSSPESDPTDFISPEALLKTIHS